MIKIQMLAGAQPKSKTRPVKCVGSTHTPMVNAVLNLQIGAADYPIPLCAYCVFELAYVLEDGMEWLAERQDRQTPVTEDEAAAYGDSQGSRPKRTPEA